LGGPCCGATPSGGVQWAGPIRRDYRGDPELRNWEKGEAVKLVYGRGLWERRGENG